MNLYNRALISEISEDLLLAENTQISFGGVTGNSKIISEYFKSIKGAIIISDYIKEDLTISHGIVNLEILLPLNFLQNVPCSIKINQLIYNLEWDEVSREISPPQVKIPEGSSYFRKKTSLILPLLDYKSELMTNKTSMAGETLDGFICCSWQTANPSNSTLSGISLLDANNNNNANSICINTWTKSQAIIDNISLFLEGLSSNSYNADIINLDDIHSYTDLVLGEDFTETEKNIYSVNNDTNHLQIKYKDNLVNQVLNVASFSNSMCEIIIEVSYLVPLAISNHYLTQELVLLDKWDFVSTDRLNFKNDFFVTELYPRDEEIILQPLSPNFASPPSIKHNFVENDYEPQLHGQLLASTKEQTLTFNEDDTINVSKDDLFLMATTYAGNIVTSTNIINIQEPDLVLTSSGCAFCAANEEEDVLYGPFKLKDSLGLELEAFKIESNSIGSHILVFSIGTSLPAEYTGNLTPVEGSVVSERNACVLQREEIATAPVSFYESILYGVVVNLDNGIKYFQAHQTSAKHYEFVEVEKTEANLLSEEWLDKCIILDGDLTNTETDNALIIKECIKTTQNYKGKVTSSIREYYKVMGSELHNFNIDEVPRNAVILDYEKNDSDSICICTTQCFEYLPPILVNGVAVGEDIDKYKKHIERTIYSIHRKFESTPNSLGAYALKRDEINLDIKQVCQSTLDIILAEKEAFCSEEYNKKLVSHSEISASINKLVKNSVTLPSEIHRSRANYLLNELQALSQHQPQTQSNPSGHISFPPINNKFTRGALLQVKKYYELGNLNIYAEDFYVNYPNKDSKFEKIDKFHLDNSWKEIPCDNNAEEYFDNVVAIDDTSLSKFRNNQTCVVYGELTAVDEDKNIPAYTIVDKDGEALFEPKPLSELGFNS
jgi:hypothetical protein